MMFWGMEFPTKMKLISNKPCLLCAHKVVISVIILCVNLLHTQKKLIWKIDGINKGYHFIQSIRYYQQAKSRLMIFMQTSFFIEIHPLIFWYVQTCYNQTTYRISMGNFFRFKSTYLIRCLVVVVSPNIQFDHFAVGFIAVVTVVSFKMIRCV